VNVRTMTFTDAIPSDASENLVVKLPAPMPVAKLEGGYYRSSSANHGHCRNDVTSVVRDTGHICPPHFASLVESLLDILRDPRMTTSLMGPTRPIRPYMNAKGWRVSLTPGTCWHRWRGRGAMVKLSGQSEYVPRLGTFPRPEGGVDSTLRVVGRHY
jgi:hypothetical protein